jgi:HTH-type transcriptional regulator / antitoxin HigA
MIQTIGNKIVGSKKHDSYLELFAKFTPRPITTESQFLATQNVIDSLIDQEHLNNDEQDYLNILGLLIKDYEENHDRFPELTGIELIKALLVEMDLTPECLINLLDSPERMAEILHNQAELTQLEKENLSHFFHLSPDYF